MHLCGWPLAINMHVKFSWICMRNRREFVCNVIATGHRCNCEVDIDVVDHVWHENGSKLKRLCDCVRIHGTPFKPRRAPTPKHFVGHVRVRDGKPALSVVPVVPGPWASPVVMWRTV
eukprot:11714479-Karenia_brevis.AAC.1